MIKRIYLEITNKCNLNCSFCTNSKGDSFIDLKTIENYLIQIKEICDYIYLHVLGEPLLHPNINEILDLLDKYNFKLQLVTNGTLLKNNIHILSHKCIRKLAISLHSVNNLSMDNEYFDTIDKIIENTKTNIELRFYQKDQLDNKLNDYLNKLINKYSLTKTSKINSYKLKENVFIQYEDFFIWPNINDPLYEENGTCLGSKTQIAILHNGDVVLCCLDSNGHTKIGNINENKLKDILLSDIYINTINNFNNNKLTFELCKHCHYRKRFL